MIDDISRIGCLIEIPYGISSSGTVCALEGAVRLRARAGGPLCDGAGGAAEGALP